MSAMGPYESGHSTRATFSSPARGDLLRSSQSWVFSTRCDEQWSGRAVAAPLDAELAHARAQRVRVDRELVRGAERAIDPAFARGQRVLDVSAHDVVERLDRRGIRGCG